jgi:hypothetical protein
MNWNLEGKRVNGMYMGLWPFRGTVTESRVKYGGQVQHTVKLAEPIRAYGSLRDVVLVSVTELNRILDERDEQYGRETNDAWYDEQFEVDSE